MLELLSESESDTPQDVEIKLTYTVNGHSSSDTAKITIRTPVATDITAGLLVDDTGVPPNIVWRNFYHQLIDQFENVIDMEDIPVVETFPGQTPPSWWRTGNFHTEWIESLNKYAFMDHLQIGVYSNPNHVILYQHLKVGDANLSPVYEMDLDAIGYPDGPHIEKESQE